MDLSTAVTSIKDENKDQISSSISDEFSEKSKETTVKLDCDPYSYTKREEFTSEIFKIEIECLPHHIGYGQIKTLLTGKLKLKPHKIKVIGKSPTLVFVTFRCEADREQALNTISGYQFKGQSLYAKKANPMADPLVRKRKAELDKDAVSAKVAKNEEENSLPIATRLQNVVTPLWHMTYEEQLDSKQDLTKKFLLRLGTDMEKINCAFKHWIKKQREINDGLCCQLLPIVGSPITRAYRNKCEFNIGLHPDTGTPTVGFRVSSYKEGSKCVADAVHCTNIPLSMIKAAEAFQEYIQASKKGIYNPENREGFWRQLTVRTNLEDHLLIIVVLHPQNYTQEEIEEEKQLLKAHFENSKLNMTSLYFQRFAKKEQTDPPLEHIWGSTSIEETLLGMKFRISPDAFFQVNTCGAEILYNTVADFASLTPETTVFDLCCGTGTIGLSIAKKVKNVIGVELCSSAVLDARYNAEANGISNAEFVCGKVEDVIFDVLKKITGDEDIVAIVDPPRAGLSNKVIKAIRGSKLQRLVYLSCSPQNASTNFTDLCRATSNNYRGSGFLPVKAVAVDLFPLTTHCELIMLLERPK